jgi:monoamine oxidase
MAEDATTTAYDCVVVGAGYSGLAATKALKEAGKTVLLLEARDRVGGRAKTIHSADGSYFDCGASFLGVQQDLMKALAREFNIPLYPSPTEGKLVLSHRGRARTYAGLIPPMRVWEVLELGYVIHKFERLCEKVNVEEPWKTPNATELDGMTLSEWFRRNSWLRVTRETAEMAVRAVLGQDYACVSVLHAMFFFKAVSTFTVALSVKGGAQEELIVGGGQAIANRIHELLGDEIVRLSEPVEAARQDEHGIEVATPKGKYRARRAIFAVPPLFLLKMVFDPPLPAEKVALLQHMPMGSCVKVFAVYKTNFWHAKGLRGEGTNVTGYISVTFDVTPPGAKHAKLMGFVMATKAREFISFSREKKRSITLGEFAAAYGDEALEPEEFFSHSMMEEDWILGCPMANPAPGMWTQCGEWVRKPVGVVHWAGTETSTRFYGYMEGAVSAGQRAAREVIEELA